MATFSKKRKRAESISNAGVSLQLSSHEIPESGAAVPVLGALSFRIHVYIWTQSINEVSTPGVELPSSTSFQVYGKKRKTGGVEPGKTMVAGETPTVEFFSSFESETNTPGSRYVFDRYFADNMTYSYVDTLLHYTTEPRKLSDFSPLPPMARSCLLQSTF